MKRSNVGIKSILAAVTITISALCVATGAAEGAQAAAAPGDRDQRRPQGVVPGQYIVVFHDHVVRPKDLADALERWHGFTLRRTYQHALKGFAARMPAAVARALAFDPDVALVEPDVYAHTTEQQTPTGVARIAAAPNPTAVDCSGVHIAIIDTGIDLDHPDLNVVQGKSFLGDNSGDGNDDNGHGTHVAGIAAAIHNDIGVVGVCPGAPLWAIKVLDSSGSGYFSDIIEGIDYVTANANQIKVANMSLGGTGYLAALRTAIQNSVAAGVVYMVAAGNNAADVYGTNGQLDTSPNNSLQCFLFGICGDDFIPAAYPEVATISAMVDTNGQPGGNGPSTSYGADDSFASYSNFSSSIDSSNQVNSPGLAIDLLMPGTNIYSTWKNGGYETISGTSMASPHAAGLAARYIVANPRPESADESWVYAVRQALINGGVPQNSPNGLSIYNDWDLNWENIGWATTAADSPPPLPGITINNVTVTEGSAGTTDVVFTVTLSAQSEETVTVNFSTTNGSATAGSDYVAKSGTLTFAPGTTSQIITVVVNGDTAVEPNETFYVNLSNATYATILDGQGAGTINNDDVLVFSDSFEVNGWSNWTQDSQKDWFRSSQRKKPGTSGRYSAEVDGPANNAALTSITIDLQGKSNATVTFSWYIESGLDTGEYIAFDVSTNGESSWVEKARLRGNVDPENTWRNVTVELSNITSLKIQFRGSMSESNEDANVDDVKVVAY